MRPLQGVGPGSLEGASASEVAGLAGWLLALARGWRGQRQRESQQRQLELVETLPLGGKRQLMLVRCAGESFLVGGGFENVETIVRLKAETPLGFAADGLDVSCR